MTYIQQYALMESPEFRGRVMLASLAAARNILSEVNDTKEGRQRKQLARAILTNPEQFLQLFLLPVIANPTIGALAPLDSTDSDLDYVIASVWNETARSVTT